ncbi:RrF2 family transcriptional regulator [Massilioclostridium coli]|uniref:RrF2 family transcriptional regulator n=1 Tax=Massilioclostridium coli TaxID=1870991 RepID=UPI0022E7F4B0|nr:Rrf2 family transcriptional regulator [Massilioclostridium coli]
MTISTKGRYALRVMIDIAQHPADEYISLKSISERQEISMKYLEAIVSMLAKSGFVESHRGKNGGYRLAHPAQDYTVREILELTEKNLAPVACLSCDENTCPRAEECITLPMWQKLGQMVDGYLESVTLADLVNREYH